VGELKNMFVGWEFLYVGDKGRSQGSITKWRARYFMVRSLDGELGILCVLIVGPLIQYWEYNSILGIWKEWCLS